MLRFFLANRTHFKCTKHPVRPAIQLLLIVCLAGFSSAADIMPSAAPQIIARCGRGSLMEISSQKVLLVAGSPYEMGYQHGFLLKDKIKSLVETVLLIARAADSHEVNDFFNGSIEKAFIRTRPFIPKRYLEEMRGLADGAQLPYEDVLLANIFPELFHCSGFALFGKATVDGQLLHGRILDYMTEVGLQNNTLVMVAKPHQGLSFVTVGYAGFIGSVTGMNSQQVAIGEIGGGGVGKWDGMPMSFLVRKALEEADTLQKAVDIFQNTPRTCEYYYVVSDGKIPDARGLACTPEKMDIIEPGQFHEKLTNPAAQTVLMSAGKRYEHLSQKVHARYGQLDLADALALMDRPIAMNSCLHRVLFAPTDLKLWVSNAIAPTLDNFEAHHQPYYVYNMANLLEYIEDTAPKTAAGIPKPPEPVNTVVNFSRGANESVKTQTVITAEVHKTITRPIPPGSNPTQSSQLQAYRFEPEDFSYQMTLKNTTAAYDVYEVKFPSAYQSDLVANNTIYCEYYRVHGEQKRPAVVLLDIMDGSLTVSRLFANALAITRVDACIMVLPHYGPRRSKNLDDNLNINSDLQILIRSIQQAVVDVQRSAIWLASLQHIDAGRIGLCGTSLGGFVAALSAGVDGQFPRVALLLAGGDLAAVVNSDAKEVHKIRQQLTEQNITMTELKKILDPVEPLNFAERLQNSKVLMVNGSKDEIVPNSCAEKFAEKAHCQVQWFNTDHYGMIKYLWPTLQKVTGHFSGERW